MNRFSSQLCLFALLLLLGGLLNAHPSVESKTSPNVANVVEQLYSAWPIDRPLLIGELHGTVESPRLVGSLVERASRDAKLLLMLEIPATEQESIRVFLASDGVECDRINLLAGAFWTRRAQDGRSSAAVLELIVEVGRLKRSGRTIEVVAYAPSGPDPRPYDLRMADAVRGYIDRFPFHRVVSYGGNAHNRMVAERDDEEDSQPMGWHLRDLDPLSIVISSGKGSYWACHGPDDCGRHELSSTRSASYHARLIMHQPDSIGRHHGIVEFAKFNASEPAMRVYVKARSNAST